MQLRSAKSTIFTSRELRMLQRLYRTRAFTQLRRSSKTNEAFFRGVVTQDQRSKTQQQNIKNNVHHFGGPDYVYTIYGSSGALSPNQRTLFRAHLRSFSAFKNSSVKFTLFSTPVSQSVRAFSNLREARFLLKGSSYQMSITVPANLSTGQFLYDNQHFSQYQLPFFFEHLKVVRFSEETTMEFLPSLMFSSTS